MCRCQGLDDGFDLCSRRLEISPSLVHDSRCIRRYLGPCEFGHVRDVSQVVVDRAQHGQRRVDGVDDHLRVDLSAFLHEISLRQGGSKVGSSDAPSSPCPVRKESLVPAGGGAGVHRVDGALSCRDVPTDKALVMHRVWQALGKSWATLLSLGLLLVSGELQTNVLGIAGDLYATLEPATVQVVKLVALVLLPVVGGVTLVGAARVLRRVVHIVDRLTRNDRWARREYMACRDEIEYCRGRLASGEVTRDDRIVNAGFGLRLMFLVDRLSKLGVEIEPKAFTFSRGWVGRLDQLALCSARGQLIVARLLAKKWSSERRE